MDKQNKTKSVMLISIGMFIIGLSILLLILRILPDYVIGVFMGVGIGLLILEIIKGRKKPVSS